MLGPLVAQCDVVVVHQMLADVGIGLEDGDSECFQLILGTNT
jgi:hypothetical protein